MCIHTIKGNLYNYQHVREGKQVHSIYLGPVSGSGSWIKNPIGQVSEGYGSFKKVHEPPIKVDKVTLQQLKDADKETRKKMIQDIAKVKQLGMPKGDITSYFNGAGEIVNQSYTTDGITYKLPNISPIKQREKIYTKRSMAHPAKMFTPLAQKLIQDYSKPGDTILDPMGGIGTTGIEASRLGRNAILVDYERRFVREAKNNVSLLKKAGQMLGDVKVLHGDARNLGRIKGVDVVVTSPPFADVQPFHDKKFKIDGKEVGKMGSGESYSLKKDNKNIGMLKGEKYLLNVKKVYNECYKTLKPNGKLIVHMKNPIKNKKMVRLDKQTTDIVNQCGFKLKERKKRHLDNVSFWTRQYRKKYPDAPKVDHEDILVFQKK
jgi:predicted methyltransferase